MEENDKFFQEQNQRSDPPNVATGRIQADIERFGKRITERRQHLETEGNGQFWKRVRTMFSVVIGGIFVVSVFMMAVNSVRWQMGKSPKSSTVDGVTISEEHEDSGVWSIPENDVNPEVHLDIDTADSADSLDKVLNGSSDTAEEHHIATVAGHDIFSSDSGSAEDSDGGEEEDDSKKAFTWYRKRKFILKYAEECETALNKYKPGTAMYNIKRADCGQGYTLPNPNATDKVWRVGLVGPWTDGLKTLAGCSYGNICPLSPRCEFVRVAKPDNSWHIDVFLTHATYHRWMKYFVRQPGQLSVLYWREALWPDVPNPRTQWRSFDLEMGVHHFAALNNPNFVIQPSFLLKGMFQNEPKTEFAASVISDCHTLSERQTYIDYMVSYLGTDRIHQFGACGNRELPGRPLQKAFKVLARYKFFLAFENTIQTGYTTEKLFTTLMLPVIPVYYGDPTAPNVTKTPSYIRVGDFPNPKSLSDYLLFLDRHPAEYQKYHEWRKSPESITSEYLKKAEQLPGPKEVLAHQLKENTWLSVRRAFCCRLCDERYLKERIASRTHDDLVTKTYQREDLAKHFYGFPVYFVH